MNDVATDLIGLLDQAYQSAYPGQELPPGTLSESISYPDQAFGDIASSVAMKVAAANKLNPRTVAEAIVAHLPSNTLIDWASVAGAGFINFRLSSNALSNLVGRLAERATSAEGPIRQFGSGKTVAMDYSHPNIGKPMGVHHLLSTIIGDSIKRTMRKAGYKVTADNFIGDLGTQFGKLIWAVKQWGDTAAIEANPITELQKLYVQFHIAADGDVELDEAAREEYLKLEQGDEENRALWHKIVAWSKAEIQPIYDALGVEFDYMHGESFYEDKMQPLLDQGVEQGIFVESHGALVCPAEDAEAPPAILRKSDGATLYLTRDLARIAYWEQAWHPDIMMVVVDEAQSFAQKQLYSVARKLKLTDAQLTQVNFGRMRFADGSMSTRKGNILLLKDLIAEAKSRALALMQEKSHGLNVTEQQVAADVLAISCIKYNVLSQNRLTDIVFDWSTMLNFEGNSAPYLLYSAVRLRSLLAKAEQVSKTASAKLGYDWSNPVERETLLLLSRYQEICERAVAENKPNQIANFTYTLAQHYNNIYNNLPILSATDGDKLARLQLSRAVEATMAHALECLGLEVPAKM